MAWPVVAAAGLSLVGGAMGNRAQRREAERNRRFQERMRNTQWQAAVSDMEAAGINPALAYGQGPAASPGGSMASQDDVISPAVSTAMQAKRLKADLKLVEQQASKAESEAESASHQAALDRWRRHYMLGIQGTGKDGRQPMLELTEAEISRAMNEARRSGLMGDTMQPIADLSKRFGEFLPPLMLLLSRGGLGAAAGSVIGRTRNFMRRRGGR
jgi:hypothetical protein